MNINKKCLVMKMFNCLFFIFYKLDENESEYNLRNIYKN